MPIDENNITLDARSQYLRKLLVRSLDGGGRGHVGPALSLIEIMRVLYDDILKVDPQNPTWRERDRCILSKGHGCIAQYVLLAEKRFFPVEALDTMCHFDSILGGHPEWGKVPGVEASTGSLGHGLPIGIGMALAAKIEKRASRVFVIMGDGEINEGSIWEAAMMAKKHQLDNLIVIIDCNKIQSAGQTKEILDMSPLPEKWQSFGFETVELNGHDVEALYTAFQRVPLVKGKPTAFLCHTVKGKGISFAEHNPGWHHKTNIEPEILEQMYQQVGGRDA